jgi:hypothetical protein
MVIKKSQVYHACIFGGYSNDFRFGDFEEWLSSYRCNHSPFIRLPSPKGVPGTQLERELAIF